MNQTDKTFSTCRIALDKLNCCDRYKIMMMLIIHFDGSATELYHKMKKAVGE